MAKAHICDVPGCNHQRQRWQRICTRCFAALPGDIRTGIITAHQSRRKADWRRECQRSAEHLVTMNAPNPRPAPVSPQRTFELIQRLLGER